LPQSGSPAIDAGEDAAALAPDGSVLTTDQRGFSPRIVGGNVDLGAVEVGARAPVTPLEINFPDGAPGSVFVVSRQDLAPGEYDVLVNSVVIGTATADSAGNITFVVATSANVSPGVYRVTLRGPVTVAQVTIAGTNYTIDPDAPLRELPVGVTAPTLNVPDTIDALELVFLPLIRK
jgi:hypothetical protein